MSKVIRPMLACALIASLALVSCGGDGSKRDGVTEAVPCDESFRGRWVRMDGGTWNVGDTKVLVTDSDSPRTLDITAADTTSFSVGSLAVSRVNDDLLSAAGGGQSFYLYRGGETGGFKAWVVDPALAGSRALGQGGVAGISLLITNILNASESYTLNTDDYGFLTVPAASSGNIYSIVPLGGAAIRLTTVYGGQMAGTVFVAPTSAEALPKATLELPANQPFIFNEGFRWHLILRITNQGGAATNFGAYRFHWQANEGADGNPAAYSYIDFYDSGAESAQATPLLPFGSNGYFEPLGPGESRTYDFWVSTDANYGDTYYYDTNLVVTLSNGDAPGPRWEDSVPVRFYKNPLVITASAQGDLPLCLISSTGMAHQFYFEGPVNQVSLSVPRAEQWRVGLSGAKAGSGFKYSLGITYPSFSADVLASKTIATDSYEPNNSAAAAYALPPFGRVDSWLEPGGLDFYAINVAEPEKKFPLDEVLVEGGTFTMGGSDPLNTYNRPLHQVTLSSFIMTATELTVGQYSDAIPAQSRILTPREMTIPALTFRPQMGLGWYEAAKACNQYSALATLDPVYTLEYGVVNGGTAVVGATADFSKNGWRLPTEAEWEYAARGGKFASATTYAGSNDPDEVAWYGPGTDLSWIHVVGMKKPNALGLYDMSGNLSEWVNDWYPNGGGYTGGAHTNPTGPASGTYKTICGGDAGPNLIYNTEKLAVAARDAALPGLYDSRSVFGFRMVRRAP